MKNTLDSTKASTASPQNNAVQNMQQLRIQRFLMSVITYTIAIMLTFPITHLGLGELNFNGRGRK